MNKLNHFSKFRIHTQQVETIKGGTNFCEWYILQREGKAIASGQMMKAMALDQIATTQGLETAMQAGGTSFMAQWS